MRLLIKIVCCVCVFSSLAMADTALTAQEELSPFEKGVEFLQKCGRWMAEPRRVNPNKPIEAVDKAKNHMGKIVIGQDEALAELANLIAEIKSGIRSDPNKPLASIWFSGPTGVGKTEASYALLSALGADRDKLIRINFNEYEGEHSSSQLKGAPAGYTGYKDKPELHPDNLKAKKIKVVMDDGKEMWINVVLLDELEKAPLSIFKFLMSALDYGESALGDTTKVDFRNTIFIAATNLGHMEAQALITAKKESIKNMGVMTAEQADLTGRYDLDLRKAITDSYGKAWKDKFVSMPEFPGRWDILINFLHLSHRELHGILIKQLAYLQSNIFKYSPRKVGIVMSPAAQLKILELGTSPEFGARDLKATIKRHVTRPLGRLSITKEITAGDMVLADVNEETGEIEWRVVANSLTNPQLAQAAEVFYPGYDLLQAKFEDDRQENPAKDEVGGARAYTLLTRKDELAKKLGKKLYIEAKLVPQNWQNGPTDQSHPGKYIKVDETYFSVEKRGMEFTVTEQALVPDALKSWFPEDKIDKFTEEQILAFARELGWKE